MGEVGEVGEVGDAGRGEERARRWRLVLGDAGGAGIGAGLGEGDARVDAALAALYEREEGHTAGLGASAPRVARWLGDIRECFPAEVVRVMQRDAIERLGLARMLLEPETLEAVEPDVRLAATLLELARVMPERARESARAVVRRVVEDLERRLGRRTRSVVGGALDRAARGRRPRRAADIDWDRTIRANLRNYVPERGTVVPARLVGYGRRRRAVERDVVLCVDQSGSMATSVVYAGLFASVLATMRALRTSLVVFDTAVADLTGRLGDPVETLFGTQLGGGTDIGRALAYCRRLITRPSGTVLILISDLHDGGPRDETPRHVAALTAAGVQVIVLLALSDDGAPSYDRDHAAALAALGVPAFACTPGAFPDLMAAALEGRDLTPWTHPA
ncbi:VWA domain-containing protein [Bailinhaonella thermotolerans]|uniref:VWA domain-containing protein n=1 Tax=Bailinhaonella thermotolerans TaxID=1070861 RepID=A0A3A4B1B2_9ACTN|nr:VWA domain-containing protein [Bailinhaonella thermotolerans]RJL34619.1 VWA domain-containing protein [Bailinhaonella thermotolerans]